MKICQPYSTTISTVICKFDTLLNYIGIEERTQLEKCEFRKSHSTQIFNSNFQHLLSINDQQTQKLERNQLSCLIGNEDDFSICERENDFVWKRKSKIHLPTAAKYAH